MLRGYTRLLVTTFAALLLPLASPPSTFAQTSYIAIIIDDIGHSRVRGKMAIELPAQLTYAVIPDTAHATSLARYAHDKGKEVMVHLPMENTHNRPLGGLALTRELTEPDYARIITSAIAQVPYASGLNNHMGSALTQEPQAMTWLMQAMKQHRLFFIDSRTTHKTVAREMAERANILNASRDIFLDNERSIYAIDQQFQRLLALAKSRKTAIAIGHPYEATISYLERALPLLAEEGVYVLSASSVMKLRLAQQQMAASEVGAD